MGVLLFACGYAAVSKDAPAEWDGLEKRDIKGTRFHVARSVEILYDQCGVHGARAGDPRLDERRIIGACDRPSLRQQRRDHAMDQFSYQPRRGRSSDSAWASQLVAELDRLNGKSS